MKKGIVLEGGAMRGLFTTGVLDVLMENGVEFDGAIGVSAGATFGCNLKSRQIGRARRYNEKYCGDRRYGSLLSWLRTGDVYEAKFCYETIPDELDVFDAKTFAENPMEFYCVATEVKTGEPVYHNCRTGDKEDILWIRASASMPLVSRIVKIGGYELLDGGVGDSIPIKKLEELGYDRNVVLLTQPSGYRKQHNKLMPLLKRALKEYPDFLRALDNRHRRYNRTLNYIHNKEEKGELFVIRPPKALEIGSLESDPKELERVYQTGRETGERVLEDLKRYLS